MMTPAQMAHWRKLDTRIDELKGSIDLLNKKPFPMKTTEEIEIGHRLYVTMLELCLAQRMLEGGLTEEGFWKAVKDLQNALLPLYPEITGK